MNGVQELQDKLRTQAKKALGKEKRKFPSRVVVQETLYHHGTDGNKPLTTGKPWSRILKSNEGAWQRTIVRTDDQIVPLLEGCWLKEITLVYIECCIESGDAEIFVALDGCPLVPVPHSIVSSGESSHFEPVEPSRLIFRGPCKITVTAVPK